MVKLTTLATTLIIAASGALADCDSFKPFKYEKGTETLTNLSVSYKDSYATFYPHGKLGNFWTYKKSGGKQYFTEKQCQRSANALETYHNIDDAEDLFLTTLIYLKLRAQGAVHGIALNKANQLFPTISKINYSYEVDPKAKITAADLKDPLNGF